MLLLIIPHLIHTCTVEYREIIFSHCYCSLDLSMGICGFSRESVIAITTNIVKCIEFRRRQNHYLGFEGHPRAGTSDDVEAVFENSRHVGGRLWGKNIYGVPIILCIDLAINDHKAKFNLNRCYLCLFEII